MFIFNSLIVIACQSIYTLYSICRVSKTVHAALKRLPSSSLGIRAFERFTQEPYIISRCAKLPWQHILPAPLSCALLKKCGDVVGHSSSIFCHQTRCNYLFVFKLMFILNKASVFVYSLLSQVNYYYLIRWVCFVLRFSSNVIYFIQPIASAYCSSNNVGLLFLI